MRIDLKNFLSGLLIACIGIVAVLGLLAPLASVTVASGTKMAENGFACMAFGTSELFGAYQADDPVLRGMIAAAGAVSLAQCAAGAAAWALGILSIRIRAVRRAAFWTAAAAVALAVAYGAFGAIYTRTYLGILDAYEVYYRDLVSAHTSAYIPAIVAVLALAGLIAVRCKVPATELRRAPAERKPKKAEAPKAAEKKPPQRELERVQLLNEYAALQRDGLLSQEEFESIKKRLLQ